MKMTDRILGLASVYMTATGVRERELSRMALGHSHKLEAMRFGAGLTVQRAERAFDWFDKNWPKNLPMPSVNTTRGRKKSRKAFSKPEKPVASALYNREAPTPETEEFPKHEQA